MFSIFRRDPASRLRKDYAKKVQQAFEAQQNGNARAYSALTAEAEKIRSQIDALNADK